MDAILAVFQVLAFFALILTTLFRATQDESSDPAEEPPEDSEGDAPDKPQDPDGAPVDAPRETESLEQALAIAREVGDRAAEATHGSRLLQSPEHRRYKTMFGIKMFRFYAWTAGMGYRPTVLSRDNATAVTHGWDLAAVYLKTDPRHAVQLMEVCVDCERAIGHPNADADAAYLAALRDCVEQQAQPRWWQFWRRR